MVVNTSIKCRKGVRTSSTISRMETIALVVNTVRTASAHADSLSIRREALHKGVPYYTTMRGALAAVMGIEALARKWLTIRSLQEYHQLA